MDWKIEFKMNKIKIINEVKIHLNWLKNGLKNGLK